MPEIIKNENQTNRSKQRVELYENNEHIGTINRNISSIKTKKMPFSVEFYTEDREDIRSKKLEKQKAEIKMKEKTGYEEKMKLLEIFVEKFTELFDFFSTSYKTLPHHLKQEILETLVRNFFYNGKKLFKKTLYRAFSVTSLYDKK